MPTKPRATTRPTTFGAVLRARRIAAGLTQQQLAAAAGFEQPHIARYEADRHDPSFEAACRLADALGVEVGELRPQPTNSRN